MTRGRAAWQRGRKGHDIPGQAVDESANCGELGFEQQVRHDLLYFVVDNDATELEVLPRVGFPLHLVWMIFHELARLSP